MEEEDPSPQSNMIPLGLKAIAQEFTKAVLRECGSSEDGEEPILYSNKNLYEFSERYFRNLSEEKNGTKSILCSIHQLQHLRNSLKGEEYIKLSSLFTHAEISGLSEESINAATQLTLRASGGDDDIENITCDTELHCIKFIAVCLSLVPCDGLVDVVDNCVLIFENSRDLLVAIETFSSLDSTHRVRLNNLATALKQHPCDTITVAILRDIHPELSLIQTPAPPPTDSFNMLTSRQSTPIVVSYTADDKAGDRPGTGITHQPDVMSFFDRPNTA